MSVPRTHVLANLGLPHVQTDAVIVLSNQNLSHFLLESDQFLIK